jgi:glc operon protein GlcG
VSISIVDANGDLLAFRRLDGASLASIDISQGKARTSARVRRPTKALEDAVAAGRTALVTAPGLVLMQGGLPITVGGVTVGAVGVSGATSEQDEQVAAAGIAALKP